jgi:hypothetical protein
MLTELIDKSGNRVGHHMTGNDMDTIFLPEIGYVRSVDGTDLARFACQDWNKATETVDVYHYDFIGYDEFLNFVMRHLENGTFDPNIVKAFIIERSDEGRYVFSQHKCDHWADCQICQAEDEELHNAYKELEELENKDES